MIRTTGPAQGGFSLPSLPAAEAPSLSLRPSVQNQASPQPPESEEAPSLSLLRYSRALVLRTVQNQTASQLPDPVPLPDSAQAADGPHLSRDDKRRILARIVRINALDCFDDSGAFDLARARQVLPPGAIRGFIIHETLSPPKQGTCEGGTTQRRIHVRLVDPLSAMRFDDLLERRAARDSALAAEAPSLSLRSSVQNQTSPQPPDSASPFTFAQTPNIATLDSAEKRRVLAQFIRANTLDCFDDSGAFDLARAQSLLPPGAIRHFIVRETVSPPKQGTCAGGVTERRIHVRFVDPLSAMRLDELLETRQQSPSSGSRPTAGSKALRQKALALENAHRSIAHLKKALAEGDDRELQLSQELEEKDRQLETLRSSLPSAEGRSPEKERGHSCPLQGRESPPTKNQKTRHQKTTSPRLARPPPSIRLSG